MPKVFISFDYSDIVSKKVVDNWKNQNMGVDISFTSQDGHSYSSKGEDFVENLLRDQINAAQKVLVLVGDNTHNRPWVDLEIHFAKTQGKPVIWTQIPDTTGSPPKEIRNTEPVKFNLESIQKALRE